MSGLAVSGDDLYFGAKSGKLFPSNSVFCIDRMTGKPKWDKPFQLDEEKLKPIFCTPTVHAGRLYFGEGLHEDTGCRFFCLDAATGKPAWANPIKTESHTEGTPRVLNGKVYFTGGDDGLFCADAGTGAKKWQFGGKAQGFHIDGPPAAASNRIFVGSGLYTLAGLAVDAETGAELWRTPFDLRSFGAPLALGDRVVYGLGTGNLLSDVQDYAEEAGKRKESAPAGAVVCLEAATGKQLWKYDSGQSFHSPLAADAFSVFATSRDGCVHCLDRGTGVLRWKTGVGGPVLAGPAVATAGGVAVAVYAVTQEGQVSCLDPRTGKPCWHQPLPGFEYTPDTNAEVLCTPVVISTETALGSRRSIYIGGMRGRTAAVFRFDDRIGSEVRARYSLTHKPRGRFEQAGFWAKVFS